MAVRQFEPLTEHLFDGSVYNNNIIIMSFNDPSYVKKYSGLTGNMYIVINI